jgi:hypothetical protein
MIVLNTLKTFSFIIVIYFLFVNNNIIYLMKEKLHI